MDSNCAVRVGPGRDTISLSSSAKARASRWSLLRHETYCFTELLCNIKKLGGGLYPLISTVHKTDIDDSHLVFKITLLKVLTQKRISHVLDARKPITLIFLKLINELFPTFRVEEQITKISDPFSSPIDIFLINKEDFPWHFNLSANNLNQPTEDPLRTLVLYDSDYKTLRTKRLQREKKKCI